MNDQRRPTSPPDESEEVGPAEAAARAALASPRLQASLAKLREATPDGEPLFGGKLSEPTRDHAPAPEDVSANDGEALVSRTAAATAYVAPTMPVESELPRMPSAKIRIAAAVDPRRQVTQRAVRGEIGGGVFVEPSPGPAAAAMVRADADVPPHALPATLAPLTAPRTAHRQKPVDKRVVVAVCTAAAVVAGLVLLLRAPPSSSATAKSASAVQSSTPRASTGRASQTAPTTVVAAAPATSTTMSGAVQPSATSVSATSPSAKPAATAAPKGKNPKPDPGTAPTTAPPVAPTAPPAQPFDPLMNE